MTGTHPSTSIAFHFVAFFGALLGGRSSFKAGIGSLSRDFVSQEHGYHTKDPKVSNAGACMREIKRATKHDDGGLDTPESTPHVREQHRSYLGSVTSW
jgi:hypothetical protein